MKGMRRFVRGLIAMTAIGCVTSKEVAGPDGEAHLISCPGSMDGCLEEAADICRGEYQIQTSTSSTSGYVSNGSGTVGTRQEILVTCGVARERMSNSQQERTPPQQKFSQSDAPAGAAGIEFGVSSDSIRAECEGKQYEWKQRGETVTCTGLLDDVGYSGRMRIKLCGDQTCEIRLSLDLNSSGEGQRLLGEYVKLHELLTEKYGRPQDAVARVSGRCKDRLLECLDDGSSKLKSIWRWKSGIRLTLRMIEDEGQAVTYLDYVSVKHSNKSGL